MALNLDDAIHDAFELFADEEASDLGLDDRRLVLVQHLEVMPASKEATDSRLQIQQFCQSKYWQQKAELSIRCVIKSVYIIHLDLPNHMLYHLFESSQDDSNKWWNIGFCEEIGILEFKVHFFSSPKKRNANLKLKFWINMQKEVSTLKNNNKQYLRVTDGKVKIIQKDLEWILGGAYKTPWI